MQSPIDSPREALTVDAVVALIEAASLDVSAGLDIVDTNGAFQSDISDQLVGGSIRHSSLAATIHTTCKLRIEGALEWGRVRVRPWMQLSDGITTAKFHLGCFVLSTPERVIGVTPETYAVEGYDLLEILAHPAGVSYTVPAGANVRDEVLAILLLAAGTSGATPVAPPSIIASSTATTLTARPYPLDQKTTWLDIVNDLLESIGFRKLWMDWLGRYRSEPSVSPASSTERAPEWTYDANSVTTIVGEDRTVISDLHDAANWWVFVRDNASAGVAGTGDGLYEVQNASDGATSYEARGRWIKKVVKLDVVDDDALAATGDAIVDLEKRIDMAVKISAGVVPLHWHDDVVAFSDTEIGAALKCSAPEWELDLGGEDMTLSLRMVGTAATPDNTPDPVPPS